MNLMGLCEVEVPPLKLPTIELKKKPAPEPASPLKSSPHWLPSPAKKPMSPIASPKYGSSVTRVPSPPPPKDELLSPPVSPAKKYPDRWIAQTSPLQSPSRSLRTSPPPPPPPLALPPTQFTAVNGTTTQPKIQPEIEQKSIVYNKTVEKPAKFDRASEYGSGKPHEKQKAAEAINLAGHNVGAVMEIDKSSVGHRLGGETVRGSVRDGNEEKKKKEKKELPMTAFTNSNFQSVNNSVLYGSSCNHRDPGLHLKFADAADGDGAAADGRKNYKA
ncbi:wiskott-Aldrich syndrome protein family member 2-like [Cucurbita moschata]|uniref:Wiskott-Aldrich syndrome protein family member 2-like n=1 Tax=Cucurbita moschata TaxID=3662 RepID=A0A6J1GDX3_CUCMO|nr:wiskott-Aldrich syndrome protein family member 2-like [Cucurbita moschata]